jgi:proteasome-associated ATPase
VKIKIARPDREAAVDIFRKYLTTDIPIAESENRRLSPEGAVVIEALIDEVVEAMYRPSEDNLLLEITYAASAS